jgi:hypothetical protein
MRRFKHMAESVDADRFTDAYLRRVVLPGVLNEAGEHPTVAEFRAACAAARAKGLEVFPPCDNVDERGRCKGHPQTETTEGERE